MIGGMSAPVVARPRRVPLTAAQRRRNRQGDQVATGLLFGVWAYVAGTPLVGHTLGVDLDLMGELFIACLTVVATAVVIMWFADLVEAGIWLVCAAIAPACYVTVRALYVGVVDFHGITIIMVTLAIAAARPRASVLRVMCVLIVITAVGSIILGFLRPEFAIQHDGDQLTERVDKQILPGLGLLIGVSPHANTMGQLIALGLPLVMLIERLWLRFVVIGVLLFTLAWTAARGSIATAAVVLVLMMVLPRIGSWRPRMWVERLAIAAAVLLCAAIPWLLRPEDDGFSARGGIWRVATQLWWSDSPLLGFGPDWFSRMAAEASSPIIAAAVTGHNQIVHLAVTGGVLLLALSAWQTITFTRATTGPAARHDVLATLIIAAIWVNGWLEYAIGYIDDVPTWPVTFPLLAVLLFGRDRRRPRQATRPAGPAGLLPRREPA